ncbi:TadE/TadG family type IV pilus assembly protein [Phreatobacter sp.]|uniref:TadE/TadG family type IV pilus assembly protein n=1 Tax=Phreatobacter sp. TaxID=1966341 RepID=UPI003F72A09B
MTRFPWLFSRLRPARAEPASADPAPVRRRGAFIKRFRRDEEGIAAVEFAFVAGPFLFLLFAIIEVAMVFFAGQVLETATSSASRLILTGQAQQQNFDQTAFKNEICRQTNVLMDCGGIGVDVRTYANFGAASQNRPTDGSGAVNFAGMGFTPGSGGDIVVVRVVYQWPVLMPSFGMQVGDLPNGKRLLMATAAFRNEPF